jgi:peptidyl-prolyl cis-trans isomerase SurA
MHLILAALLIVLVSCGWRSSPPPNVAATVNNRPVTNDDLEKQFQAFFSQSGEPPSGDQALIQKMEVLRTLIDNEILLQRAEKLSLMATDSDVEAKFNELKAPFTQEEFQKKLAQQKLSMEQMKTQLRRDLSIQKLFNKEITSKINITDKDITDFYNANKASFNLAEPQVHLAQILVTPQPDPNVHNLKNDKAQDDLQARKKIEMIAARLRQGEDFSTLAQNYSEDTNSAPNGGDLGFIPESTLDKANVDLRKAIFAMSPGQTTQVLKTSEGYRILKVISKEPSGQRDLTDPKVQQSIRETLINRKDQLLKAAYYEVARNEAKVVNYFAANISGGK